MTSPTAFRHFRLELRSLAGFHTGAHQVLDDAHLSDISVHAHEKIHGRIFDETLDGSLHKIVLTLLKENADPDLAKQLNEVNDFLFDDVMLAHERAATFLGVAALSTSEERIAARAALDDQYVSYYDFFDRLLPWRDSTYVTFVVAYAMVRFAFNSDRLAQMQDFSALTVARLREIEGPLARLEAAASAFSGDVVLSSQAGIRQLFDRCMSEEDIEPFDVFDDSEWIARAMAGRVDTQKLERMMFDRLERILVSKTGRTLNFRIVIPPWASPILERLAIRDFDVEFPLVDGNVQYPEHVARHFAAESDRDLIGRRAFAEFPEVDLGPAVQFIAEHIEAEPCIVFMQLEGQPRRFKLFASVAHNGGYSYAPGCGLVLDIEDVARVAYYLGDIVVRTGIQSPLFYIVYAPGEDLSGETVLVPVFEGDVKLFPGHLGITGVPAPGQGLLVRPLIYARRYWSHLLSSTEGELRRYSVGMVDQDAKTTVDYLVHVLVPQDRVLIPSFAIMTAMPQVPYLSLARHAAAAGRLTLETPEGIPRGPGNCLIAVWETLSLV